MLAGLPFESTFEFTPGAASIEVAATPLRSVPWQRAQPPGAVLTVGLPSTCVARTTVFVP